MTLTMTDFGLDLATDYTNTDVSAQLTAAMTASVVDNIPLDLEGKSYRSNTRHQITGNLCLLNGEIGYAGPSEGTAFAIDGNPNFRDFRLKRLGSINLIGLQIINALQASLVRCHIYNWRNSDSLALQIDGCQIMHMQGCRIWDNNQHMKVGTGNSVSTDLKVYASTFINHFGAMPGVQLTDTSSVKFDGCDFETSRLGELLRLQGTKYTRITSTRFEGTGLSEAGVHSHVTMQDCLLTKFDQATFNSTSVHPTTGIQPKCIDDVGSTFTSFYDVLFPSSSPSVGQAMAQSLNLNCVNFHT